MDSQIGSRPSDSSASKFRPMAHKPERSNLRPAFLRRFKPFAPFFALVALSLLTGALNPRFFEFNNVVRIANSAAIPLVLALGETFVIVLGSIDLSVEGVLAVGSVLISLLVRNDSNANSLGWIGAALAIAICAAIGCVNGLIHVNLRIPSFMATLGMWFVGVGMATLILGGSTVRVLDGSIRSLALTRLFVFPLAVWVALGALGLTWLFERYTRIGRYIYAIGGGEDLAALSGIPVKRVKLIVFTLAGALYGLSGLLAAAQLGLGNAMIGSGRLFFTITAVVVGGSALTGGEGGVLNTFVGVLIIAVLANGMVLLGISPYVQQAVQGLLIIVAVALSIDRARLKIVK
jgi:ribose transport system permease protein